jgi:hypothetical protein
MTSPDEQNPQPQQTPQEEKRYKPDSVEPFLPENPRPDPQPETPPPPPPENEDS